eukprot:1337721-Amphidinium_carterae.1
MEGRDEEEGGEGEGSKDTAMLGKKKAKLQRALALLEKTLATAHVALLKRKTRKEEWKDSQKLITKAHHRSTFIAIQSTTQGLWDGLGLPGSKKEGNAKTPASAGKDAGSAPRAPATGKKVEDGDKDEAKVNKGEDGDKDEANAPGADSAGSKRKAGERRRGCSGP